MPDKERIAKMDKEIERVRESITNTLKLSADSSKIRGDIIIDSIALEDRMNFIIVLHFSPEKLKDFHTSVLAELRVTYKIKILQKINLIDTGTINGLIRLNEIRNQVAHSPVLHNKNELYIVNKKKFDMKNLKSLRAEFNEVHLNVYLKLNKFIIAFADSKARKRK